MCLKGMMWDAWNFAYESDVRVTVQRDKFL